MNWREHVMTAERRQLMSRHRLISAKVAAAILGVTSRRVLQMAHAKQLPAAMVDDGYCGQFIFSRREVEHAARAREVRKTQQQPAAPRRLSRWGKAQRHQPAYQRAVDRHDQQTGAQ